MHVLSEHSLVKDIKRCHDIFSLPDVLIKHDKFRAKVTDVDDNTVYIYMHKGKTEYKDFDIKKIKIEYSILYDAASDEAKRAYDKSIKKIN